MSIAKALLELGYSEFIVTGETFEGIKWIVEPEKKPTKKQIEDKIKIMPTQEEESKAKLDARNSAIKKLGEIAGLTEAELNAIL